MLGRESAAEAVYAKQQIINQEVMRVRSGMRSLGLEWSKCCPGSV